MKTSPSASRPGSRWRGSRRVLWAILLASLALRLILVFRGGQGFWPDELRAVDPAVALASWEQGDYRAALLRLIGTGAHLGFKVLLVLPTWLDGQVAGGARLPSVFLCLASVANIGWVWRIARRAGADEREALWAASAMAASVSMAYWSRHLMPYDLALFWALGCASFASRARPRALDSWLAGAFGLAAFVTYAGTWSLVASLLVAHVLAAARAGRAAVRRAILGLTGLALPFGFLAAVDAALGVDLLASYRSFSTTITQGDYHEGHLIFFGYLWDTERLSAVAWLAAVAAFLVLSRSASPEDRRRGWWWLSIVVGTTALLIGGSNLAGRFVVYGRLARQVVPFCALLVGWSAARVFRGPPWRWKEVAALSALLAWGLYGMRVPLRQEFPREFHRRAVVAMDRYRETHLAGDPTLASPDRFRLLYDGHIYPYPAEPPPPPEATVLLRSRHPQSWGPYLYEGFTHAQRDLFDQAEFSMQLVLLPAPRPGPEDPAP